MEVRCEVSDLWDMRAVWAGWYYWCGLMGRDRARCGFLDLFSVFKL